MNIVCDSCGEDILLAKGRFAKRHGSKTHIIVFCKSCGRKNFVPVIARAEDKWDDALRSLDT